MKIRKKDCASFPFSFKSVRKNPGLQSSSPSLYVPVGQKNGQKKYYLNLLTNSTTATSEIPARMPPNPKTSRLRVRDTVIGLD
jgi:hypothetical protein